MNYPKNTDDKKNLLDALSQLDTQELKYLWLIWDKCNVDKNTRPIWPEDVSDQVAIIHDSSWRITKASLDYDFGTGNSYRIYREALHTAAMAYRLLITSEKRS